MNGGLKEEPRGEEARLPPRVSLVTPMNRGLKVGQAFTKALFTTVSLVTPMNRGLKEKDNRHRTFSTRLVSLVTPMNRGLKVERSCLCSEVRLCFTGYPDE